MPVRREGAGVVYCGQPALPQAVTLSDILGGVLKTIALIAHDGKKEEMIAFAQAHRERLEEFKLIATGTTGGLVQEKVGLEVQRMLSGPIGGDVQIAGEVVSGEVAAVIFFVDNLAKHPHDPDIQTLLRLCNVHNVPLATNPATARLIIDGDL